MYIFTIKVSLISKIDTYDRFKIYRGLSALQIMERGWFDKGDFRSVIKKPLGP